jgi:hypothetical protein
LTRCMMVTFAGAGGRRARARGHVRSSRRPARAGREKRGHHEDGKESSHSLIDVAQSPCDTKNIPRPGFASRTASCRGAPSWGPRGLRAGKASPWLVVFLIATINFVWPSDIYPRQKFYLFDEKSPAP